MGRSGVLSWFVLSVLAAAPARAADPVIAVPELSAAPAQADEARAISAFVRQAVVKAGLFTVLDKADLDRLGKGKALPGAGCITVDCAVRLGTAYGAGKVIVGEYTLLGGTRFLTALLVDVGSGKLERDAKEKGFDLGNADEAAERLVAKLTGRSPPPPSAPASAPLPAPAGAPSSAAAAVPPAVASHPNFIRFRSILEQSGLKLNQYSKDPEKPLVSLPDRSAVPSIAWIEVALTNRDRGVIGLEVGSPVYGKDGTGKLPTALQERVDRANREAGAKWFELKSWGRAIATRELDLASQTPGSLLAEVTRFATLHEAVCRDLAPYIQKETPAAASAPASAGTPAQAGLAAGTWRTVINKRDRLEKGQGLMQGLNADLGERWRFKISAASGSGFDAFVVDALNKVKYEGILDRGSGSMDSLVSRKSFERVSWEWSPPSTGKYYLIVDNTSFPDGGSRYDGWFDVDILVEYLPAN